MISEASRIQSRLIAITPCMAMTKDPERRLTELTLTNFDIRCVIMPTQHFDLLHMWQLLHRGPKAHIMYSGKLIEQTHTAFLPMSLRIGLEIIHHPWTQMPCLMAFLFEGIRPVQESQSMAHDLCRASLVQPCQPRSRHKATDALPPNHKHNDREIVENEDAGEYA